jgi:hypothetical protein
MFKIDKKVFDKNLLLTQTYCEMQLANTGKSVAEILRSFNPEYNGKQVFSYKDDGYKQVIWSVNPLDKENEYLCKSLFENQLQNKMNYIRDSLYGKQFKGIVLVVELNETQLDGGATAYSNGLFDIYDLPPVDTWFYSFKNKNTDILLAWIPEKYMELADEGMSVSLNSGIYWLEDWEMKNDRFIQGTSRYSQPHKNFIQRNPFIIKVIIALSFILLCIYYMLGG